MKALTMKALTSGQKNLLDTVLGAAGLFFGWLGTNVAVLPPQYQAVGGIAGLLSGYAVADAISYVDTGTLPTATVKSQILSVMQASRTPVEDEIKNLVADPTQQKILLAVIDSYEQQLMTQLAPAATSPFGAAIATTKPLGP